MIIEKGLNINDSTGPWTELLLTGVKTIETRNQNNLKAFIGVPVGVIRTGKGKAHVVGFIKLGEVIHYKTAMAFRKDFNQHRVVQGSEFDFNGVKFGYPVEVIEILDKPIPVTTRGIVTRKIKPYEIR